MLRFQNCGQLLLDRAPRRLPAQQLLRPHSFSSGVQAPALCLESSLLDGSISLQSFLLERLDKAKLLCFMAGLSSKIAPDMLAILDEVVAFSSPQALCLAGNSGFDEQNKDVCQVGYMDIVPSGFAGSDDWDVFAFEDELC
jgi:hypothetical protein